MPKPSVAWGQRDQNTKWGTGDINAATAEIRTLDPGTPKPGIATPPLNSPDTSAGFLTNLRANLAPNLPDKIKRYSTALGVPEDMFGVDGEGNIYYLDPNTGRQTNVAATTEGASGPIDWFTRLGNQVAVDTPAAAPQLLGAAAGIATGNPVLGVPAAGATAGAVDFGRQVLDRAWAGESPLDIDYGNVALQAGGAAALEGGGRLLGAAASKLYNRNPGQLKPADAETVLADPSRAIDANRVSQYAQNNNSFVTLGEASDLGGQLSRERFLRTTDQGAGLRNMVRDRNIVDVPRIAARTIAPRVSADSAVSEMRQAATDAMKMFETRRADAARPLYEKAFEANQSVMSPTISKILDTPAGRQALRETATLMQNRMSRVGIPDAELGELARELAELGMMEKPVGGVASGLKLSALDYVKQTLWDMGERAAATGDRANAAAYKNLSMQLRNELDRLDVTAMAGPRAKKPEGGLYAQARKTYGDQSSAVTESERLLARFAGREDAPTIGSMDTFLSMNRTTPEETAKVRFTLAAAGKLQQWDDATRVWLADQFMDAARAAGEGGNIAGAFHKRVWGDARQRQIIEAALGGREVASQQIDALDSMFQFFRAVGRQLPEGSSTGSNTAEAKSIAGGPMGRVLSAALKVLSPTNWGTEMGNAAGGAAARDAYRKLIQVALTPENSRALQNLRLLGPKWERGIPTIVRIIEQAGLIPARQLDRPPEQSPAGLLPAPAIP